MVWHPLASHLLASSQETMHSFSSCFGFLVCQKSSFYPTQVDENHLYIHTEGLINRCSSGRTRFSVTTHKTHLFLCVEVCVVLGHVLRRPLLDQSATQQPDGQADHKHADVRDEHSDAVPCVCTNHTWDKQKTEDLL